MDLSNKFNNNPKVSSLPNINNNNLLALSFYGL